jgi:hypothetical protein
VKFRLRVFVVDRLADAIRDPLMYEVMTFSSAGYVLSLTIGLAGIHSLVMDWLGAEQAISKNRPR